MTYKSDPVAEKLDKVAIVFSDATGLTSLQRRLKSDGPAPSRVLSWVLLASSVIGMAVQIGRPGSLGFWIVWMAWVMTSGIFRQLGPLGQSRILDEREAALFRRSHFTGMTWTLGLVVIGCLAIGLGKMGAMIQLWNLWAPQTPWDWLTITLFLIAFEVNVAVLAAISATPEPLEDEED
jgi:hypothetical protein